MTEASWPDRKRQTLVQSVRSVVLHNLYDGSPRELESQIVATVELLANDVDKKIRRRARRALAAYRRIGVINVE